MNIMYYVEILRIIVRPICLINSYICQNRH